MTAGQQATAAPRSPGTSPLLGLLRTLGLLLGRRVGFHRDNVGRLLVTDDGERFTVFRHVTVGSGDGAARALFIVRFAPARMTVRQNIRFSRLPMLVILGFRGLVSKYWCVDEATGRCQGVYEWRSREEAEAYASSIALRFMTARSIPGSVSYRILERGSETPWPIVLVPRPQNR